MHSPLECAYHDTEWGVPQHDDRRLFEFLILEGAQAGLSWRTILQKREGYRAAFHQFDMEQVARMTAADAERLRQNPAIVRNRLKIAATLDNARAALRVRERFGSLDAYLWRFVEDQPVQNHWTDLRQLPASTPLSDRMSKELKRDGFRFVGSTICYALMQAVGMVNDHTVDCFRHSQVQGGEDAQ